MSKMNNDVRKKLMGFGIVSDTVDFIPTIEGVDEEFLPIFKIKNLSVLDTKKLKTMTIDSVTDKKISNKEIGKRSDFLDTITQKSIVGFSNLLDLSTDKEVEFEANKDGYITDELFNALPMGLRVLIMNNILELAGLV